VRGFRAFALGAALAALPQLGLGAPDAVARARRASDAGRHDQVVEILTPLLRTGGRVEEEAYVLLAGARLALGQPKEAVSACDAGAAAYSRSTRFAGFDVLVLRATLSGEPLVARLEARLATGHKQLAYRKALGGLLARDEARNPEAGPLLAAVVSEAPDDAEARYLYGTWACLQAQWPRCVEELTAAVRLQPGDDLLSFQCQTLIGMAGVVGGDPTLADEAFRNAWAVAERLPKVDPAPLQRYVEFLIGQGRNDEAERAVERLLVWAPVFVPAIVAKARLLERKRDLSGAAAVAERALELAPAGDAEARRSIHALLARVCFALGQTEKAREHQAWIEAHQEQ
jgi:tetratricopeptide (TPR) repeat protein